MPREIISQNLQPDQPTIPDSHLVWLRKQTDTHSIVAIIAQNVQKIADILDNPIRGYSYQENQKSHFKDLVTTKIKGTD